MTRQETEEVKAPATRAPRDVPGVPKYRSGNDWSKVPDYSKLPAYSLIGTPEVSLITGMSDSVISKRVAAGEFPAPSRHGKNRVWPLGRVRAWCEKVAQSSVEGGVK